MNSLWKPSRLSIVIAFAFSSAYAQTVPDKVNLNEITVKGQEIHPPKVIATTPSKAAPRPPNLT